jgi:hypothetical protein
MPNATVRANARPLPIPKADPIVPAIELHRETWAAFVELDHAETRDPKLHKRAHKAARRALSDLMKTAPTTLAGLRAAIAYFVNFDEGCIPETSGEYLPTLLRSPVFATEGRAAQ